MRDAQSVGPRCQASCMGRHRTGSRSRTGEARTRGDGEPVGSHKSTRVDLAAEVIALYLQGFRVHEIVSITGVSRSTVHRLMAQFPFERNIGQAIRDSEQAEATMLTQTLRDLKRAFEPFKRKEKRDSADNSAPVARRAPVSPGRGRG